MAITSAPTPDAGRAARRVGALAAYRAPRARPWAAGLAVWACMQAPQASALSGQGAEGRPRPVPAVDDFVHDGSVAEWRARPVDRILPAAEGRPQALTWVGQVPGGLVVALEIRGGLPSPPMEQIEISLAGADPPRLPPVGWGHQFGFETLPDSAACAGRGLEGDPLRQCSTWYARQMRFRATLPLLFERAWRLDLGGRESPLEVRASAAFAALDPASKRSVGALTPRAAPTVRSREIAGTEGGVGHEVFIPWSAFPPVPASDLERVALGVRWVERGAAPLAAISRPAPRPLGRALRHRITPCEYGLAGLFIPGSEGRSPRLASEQAVAYMTPEASGDLRSLIVLDQPAAGYQYDPDPDARSPSAYEVRYGVLDVGRGERLCTPILALASESGRVTPPDWTTSRAGDPWAELADLRDVDVRRQEDGDLVVLRGPSVAWTYYGSGQCGACPRVGVDVFHVGVEGGEVTPLLHLAEVAEPGSREFEIDVSQDWTEVTLFVGTTDWAASAPAVTWRAERYCRAPGTAAPYVRCEIREDVPEPPLRLRSRYAAER